VGLEFAVAGANAVVVSPWRVVCGHAGTISAAMNFTSILCWMTDRDSLVRLASGPVGMKGTERAIDQHRTVIDDKKGNNGNQL
jgi:hypothetical protein